MSLAASISTLSEFLLQAQTQHKVFDLGRGIRPISNQTFFEWENQLSPCAFPRQNHAWFCIAFWNKKLSEERFIWFIKLPLDENGLMISAALQQFLDIITQALGKELEHTQNSKAQLPENPYVFTPSQQQLADCNAHIKKSLGLETRNNTPALAYLHSPNAIQDPQAWAALSLQDIADFVIHPQPVYKTDQAFQLLIATNLNTYSAAVQNCLFASLESVEVGHILSQALVKFHRSAAEPNLAALCLRAMSYKPQSLSVDYIAELINTENITHTVEKSMCTDVIATCTIKENEKGVRKLDIETCVVIAGRYWRVLNNEKNLQAFMQNVALIDNSYTLFKGLYSDLVKIPEIRSAMLRFIRQTVRSNEVSKAIGALFAST
jgi:hypothetical protein